MKAKTVTLVGACDPSYPLQKKRHSFEYLRTIAHLRPRTNTFYAVFRIRSLAAQFIHAFFAERGFVYVHTPLITTSDAEGAGEMFQVTTLDVDHPPRTQQGAVDYSQDFFGKQANLTVSGQLNVETFCMWLTVLCPDASSIVDYLQDPIVLIDQPDQLPVRAKAKRDAFLEEWADAERRGDGFDAQRNLLFTYEDFYAAMLSGAYRRYSTVCHGEARQLQH